MAKIYDRIEQLCKERGITGGKMCNDLNISRSTITELRKGRVVTLKLEKARIIADYFAITVDELMGNEQKETAKEDEIKFDDFTYAMHNESKTLSDKSKQTLLEMAEFLRHQQEQEGRK